MGVPPVSQERTRLPLSVAAQASARSSRLLRGGEPAVPVASTVGDEVERSPRLREIEGEAEWDRRADGLETTTRVAGTNLGVDLGRNQSVFWALNGDDLRNGSRLDTPGLTLTARARGRRRRLLVARAGLRSLAGQWTATPCSIAAATGAASVMGAGPNEDTASVAALSTANTLSFFMQRPNHMTAE